MKPTVPEPHHVASRYTQTFLRRARYSLFFSNSLLIGNLLLQVAALLAWIPVHQNTLWAERLSWFEMGLMLLLLIHGAAIIDWCRKHPRAAELRPLALLNWFGLLLCTLGDGVNKNFSASFYTYDDVIRHSYLIDSIYCFFPGYSLLLIALILLVRRRVQTMHWLIPLLLAIPLGGGAFFDLWQDGMSIQAGAMMLLYSCLITSIGLMAWPLLRAYPSRNMVWLALGAVLATLADALIGRYWIATDNYYPAIRYWNWILYFSSQLLLQQMPLRLVLSSMWQHANEDKAAPTLPSAID